MNLAASQRMSPSMVAIAGQTDFPIAGPQAWPLLDPAGLYAQVTRDGISTTYDQDQVSAIAVQDVGFTARLAVPCQAGDIVVVYSLLPSSRDGDLALEGAIRTEPLNDQFTRLAAKHQEVMRELNRAWRNMLGTPGPIMPPPSALAGRVLGFDDQGAPIPGQILSPIDLSSVDPATARVRLGVGRTVSLEYYAAEAGIVLGTGDDTAAFTAYAAAAAAAAPGGGLICELPDMTLHATHIVIPINGGYVSPKKATTIYRTGRAPDSAAVTSFVELADPYATNWVFGGIKLRGGWDFGRPGYTGADGDASPLDDPWRGVDHGCSFMQAFANVDDAQYIANGGQQTPRARVWDVEIWGFGGDGFRCQGAGSSTYGPIQVKDVGGHHFYIDQYDCKFFALDGGGSGLSSLLIGPNGADNQFSMVKCWFYGRYAVAGDDNGIYIHGSQNHLLGVEMQDGVGDALVIDGGVHNTVIGDVNWEGAVGPTDNPASVFTSKGAQFNTLILNASITPAAQAFPHVTKVIRDLISVFGQYARDNHITILADGWPADTGAWNAAWIDGPLDTSNSVTINRVQRLGELFYVNADNKAPVTILANGQSAGMVLWGDGSTFPGLVNLFGSNQSVIISGQDAGVFSPAAIEVDKDGKVAFFGGIPTSKPAITASRTGVPALALQLMTALKNLGLITDNSVP